MLKNVLSFFYIYFRLDQLVIQLSDGFLFIIIIKQLKLIRSCKLELLSKCDSFMSHKL